MYYVIPTSDLEYIKSQFLEILMNIPLYKELGIRLKFTEVPLRSCRLLVKSVDSERLVSAHKLLAQEIYQDRRECFLPFIKKSQENDFRIVLPPLAEFSGNQHYFILDGSHRSVAAGKLGFRRIGALVIICDNPPPEHASKSYKVNEVSVASGPILFSERIENFSVELFRPVVLATKYLEIQKISSPSNWKHVFQRPEKALDYIENKMNYFQSLV